MTSNLTLIPLVIKINPEFTGFINRYKFDTFTLSFYKAIDILPSASRGIPNLAVFGSFCFLSSYLAHFGTNDTRAFLCGGNLRRVARLSPTGTDPDRPNPQTFCFTSTLCPNAEGSKDLFSFNFLFLKLCRPCSQVFLFGRTF